MHDIGITIHSSTSDGAHSNISAFKELGCCFDVNSAAISPRFKHAPSNRYMYVILDACHMLKLARNTFADKNNISASFGNIDWGYIIKLNKMQQDIGLKFANKLSCININYKNSVMKVNLAAQTLNSGVADAIDYLRKRGNPDFTGSEGTVEFIRIIDVLFDFLNSRNTYGKHFKKPITIKNLPIFENRNKELVNKLKTIKIDNIPIINHPRKMFVMGFITSLHSVYEISKELLFQKHFKYILTYKFSQDHLELFFILYMLEVVGIIIPTPYSSNTLFGNYYLLKIFLQLIALILSL